MKHAKYVLAASLLAPSAAVAAGAPTITIACFGSDLTLTSKADTSGTAQLAAEVLSVGDGRIAPVGSVKFLVDNVPVGPVGGVPLRPGHDPRTGQAVGLAALSLPVVASELRLSPGSHTVTARFIPASNSALASSTSNAVHNLRIDGTAVVSAPTPTSPPATPPRTDEVDLAPPAAVAPPLQTAAVDPPPPLPPPSRAWISLEENVLHFSHDAAPSRLVNNFVPNIVGSTVNLGPVPSSPGFIGILAVQENTVLSPSGSIFGGPIDTGIHNGQTISAGYWLDPGREAIEGEFFFADPTSHNAFVTPNGGTNLAVQVVNPGGGTSNYVISETPTSATSTRFINTTPDVFVGLYNTVQTDGATGTFGMSTTTNLLSADAKYRLRLWGGTAASLDFTAGLRYADLNETADIGTNVTSYSSQNVFLMPALGLPFINFGTDTSSVVATSDTFTTRNRFLGPQLGLSGKYEWGQLWISGDAKLALGPMFESLHILGATNSTTTVSADQTKQVLLAGIPIIVGIGGPPTLTTTSSSKSTGLFGRSGSWGNMVFAAVPSANFKIGYDVIPDVLSLTAGYSAMFLSTVIRPASQINNPNPGNFNQTGFWAQGVTVGLAYRFD